MILERYKTNDVSPTIPPVCSLRGFPCREKGNLIEAQWTVCPEAPDWLSRELGTYRTEERALERSVKTQWRIYSNPKNVSTKQKSYEICEAKTEEK